MLFMTALICDSLGFLPIDMNIARIMFSLIGGFLASSRLKSQREMKKPATSPPTKTRTRIKIKDHTAISIIALSSLGAAVVLAVVCSN